MFTRRLAEVKCNHSLRGPSVAVNVVDKMITLRSLALLHWSDQGYESRLMASMSVNDAAQTATCDQFAIETVTRLLPSTSEQNIHIMKLSTATAELNEAGKAGNKRRSC